MVILMREVHKIERDDNLVWGTHNGNNNLDKEEENNAELIFYITFGFLLSRCGCWKIENISKTTMKFGVKISMIRWVH
jgi:hypothetical protein